MQYNKQSVQNCKQGDDCVLGVDQGDYVSSEQCEQYTGMTIKNGICTCVDNAVWDSQKGNCACDKGYMYDKVTNSCYLFNNFYTASAAISCNSGYKLENDQCVQCSNNLWSLGGTSTSCDYCPPGLYYNNSQCTVIPQGNVVANNSIAQQPQQVQCTSAATPANLLRTECTQLLNCAKPKVDARGSGSGTYFCACQSDTHISLNQESCTDDCGSNTSIFYSPDYSTSTNKFSFCVCKSNDYVVDLQKQNCISRDSCTGLMTVDTGKCVCDSTITELNDQGECICKNEKVINIIQTSCIEQSECNGNMQVDSQKQRCICKDSFLINLQLDNCMSKEQCIQSGGKEDNGACVCDLTIQELNVDKCECKNNLVMDIFNDTVSCIESSQCVTLASVSENKCTCVDNAEKISAGVCGCGEGYESNDSNTQCILKCQDGYENVNGECVQQTPTDNSINNNSVGKVDNSNLGLIIGIIVGAILLISITTIAIIFALRKKKAKKNSQNNAKYNNGNKKNSLVKSQTSSTQKTQKRGQGSISFSSKSKPTQSTNSKSSRNKRTPQRQYSIEM